MQGKIKFIKQKMFVHAWTMSSFFTMASKYQAHKERLRKLDGILFLLT